MAMGGAAPDEKEDEGPTNNMLTGLAYARFTFRFVKLLMTPACLPHDQIIIINQNSDQQCPICKCNVRPSPSISPAS
jgi:hypothetical protein